METSLTLQRAAANLGISYLDIHLHRGPKTKEWISPEDGRLVGVEDAVLATFKKEGWRGYSGEGGLILNLIKAMSFEKVPPRNRATYIESLYTHKVTFDGDRFTSEKLLTQVAVADRGTVERNFDLMASRETLTTVEKYGCLTMTSTDSASMLDFFPRLERWMFVELLEVAGNKLIHDIASKFMEAPYEYRRGWPDITMWKDGELRFVEVKAPGDRLLDSQEKIVAEFAKPLGLRFSLASVHELKSDSNAENFE